MLLLVANSSNATGPPLAILLNNKLPLSILLVDDGAPRLFSRVLVVRVWVRVLFLFCSEVRILGILSGP